MAVENNAPIVSEDEIEAALAEAEGEANIPDLNDGRTEVVPIPVSWDNADKPADATPCKKINTEFVATVSAPDEPAPAGPAAARFNWLAPLRARLALLLAQFAPLMGRIRPLLARIPFKQWRRIGPLLYEALDFTLWALNRPFLWLPSHARHYVGVAAIAVIVTSLLCLYVLPTFFPHQTTPRLLRQRAAAVRQLTHAPPPAADPNTP